MPRAHTHLAVVQLDQRGGSDFCSWRVQHWGHDAFLQAWKVQISARDEDIDRMLFPDITISHLHIYAAPEWCRAPEPFESESIPGEKVEVIPMSVIEAIESLHFMLTGTSTVLPGLSPTGALIKHSYPGLAHAIDRVTRHVFPEGTF